MLGSCEVGGGLINDGLDGVSMFGLSPFVHYAFNQRVVTGSRGFMWAGMSTQSNYRQIVLEEYRVIRPAFEMLLEGVALGGRELAVKIIRNGVDECTRIHESHP